MVILVSGDYLWCQYPQLHCFLIPPCGVRRVPGGPSQRRRHRARRTGFFDVYSLVRTNIGAWGRVTSCVREVSGKFRILKFCQLLSAKRFLQQSLLCSVDVNGRSLSATQELINCATAHHRTRSKNVRRPVPDPTLIECIFDLSHRPHSFLRQLHNTTQHRLRELTP